MTEKIGAMDVARYARSGLLPMSPEQGLALLDAASTAGPALTVTARFDLRAFGSGDVPSILRGLVPAVRRRPVAAVAPASSPYDDDLAARLARLSAPKQESMLLDLVRTHVAAVLGSGSPQAVQAERGFLDMGVSSLTALELRNRLNAATGLKLASTAVFDHPTPAGLAQHLQLTLLGSGPGGEPGAAELSGLEAVIAGAALDADARQRLARRLQELQWLLDGGSDQAGSDSGRTVLEAETDDEMFDLIDKELGLPSTRPTTAPDLKKAT